MSIGLAKISIQMPFPNVFVYRYFFGLLETFIQKDNRPKLGKRLVTADTFKKLILRKND